MELVERHVPLQELKAAWHSATSQGCLALIHGEAGIGKTSLVAHFVAHFAEQLRQRKEEPARLLWGACDDLFTPRPLGPLHDMAGQLSGTLSRLLQEKADRSLLFAACLSEFQSQPTIAVIEDIHWADEATLDLLKYLGRRIHFTQTLLIVTYRDDELSPQHPLRRLLGDLATSTAVRRLPLTPLSPEGVRRLARNSTLDAAELYRLTDGNPFFVTEVLAAAESGIPATVRDAVLARAARLSLSGRAALNAAAVIGPRLNPWLLAEVIRAEAEAVNESLDLGMLLVQGDTLAFRHELARQAILDSIPPHQRLFLHQAVLDALKASPIGRQDVARLAHHAEGAGNDEAILTYAPAAAEAAQKAGMLRTAATLWLLAIQHSQEQPALQRATFYAAFAAAAKENPDRTEAIHAYRQAVALGQVGGDHLLVGNSLARMAILLLMEGKMAEAVDTVEEALSTLAPLPPNVPLAVAHKTRAYLHLIEGEITQAVARANQCLEVAAHLENTDLHIEAYHALGICSLPHSHNQGCRYLEKSLDLILQEKAYWAAGSVYADLIMTYVDVYRLQRAEDLITAGLRITAEHDLDLSRLVIRAWQAILLIYHTRWEGAEAIINELLDQQHRLAAIRIPALVARGRLYARRGQPGVWKALDEALELSHQVKNDQRLGVVYIARAEAAWLAGNTEHVRQEAAAIYPLTITNKQPGFAAELTYWRWRSGETVDTFDWMVRPFVLEIEGDWRGAAAAWKALGCPYEQARALAEGDVVAQKAALLIFEQLGARPMIEYTRQKLRQAGIQRIPRGPRPTTKKNPFGLTNRQLEILELLTENLTNAEIATRLHISPKTVDHHVSAVLARLDVSSRDEAAALARQHNA
jgi:DNA-binding CsgD family transcriptional regulator